MIYQCKLCDCNGRIVFRSTDKEAVAKVSLGTISAYFDRKKENNTDRRGLCRS